MIIIAKMLFQDIHHLDRLHSADRGVIMVEVTMVEDIMVDGEDGGEEQEVQEELELEVKEELEVKVKEDGIAGGIKGHGEKR